MNLFDHLSKYQGQQDPDLHGSVLTWPGANGFPYRGEFHGLLTEAQREQVPVQATFRCGRFRTWDGPEMQLYQKIMDRVANGWFFVRSRTEPVWCPEQGGWTWWLEWQEYYSDPTRVVGAG